MRRAAVTVSILAAFAAGVPAGAQIAGQRNYDPPPPRQVFLPDSRPPGPGAWHDVENIRDNIRHARDAGYISRREARRLDRQARSIAAAAIRYGRDGLSHSERAELDARIAALASTVGR